MSSLYEIFHFTRCLCRALRNYLKSLQIFETKSTTKLLDLNDDCLDKIFEHMDVVDLCSAAKVCKRFQQLAELYFQRKYSQFDFSTLSPDRWILNTDARDVLQNFGHLIKSLNVPRIVLLQEDLLKDIVECCGIKLQSLTLKNFYFTSYTVDALKMLSESMESLSLVRSVWVGCAFDLYKFTSLKCLTITNTIECTVLMGSFPALQYLSLYKVCILDAHAHILQHFIVRHRQLETLIIKHCRGIASDVVRSIGTNMENLKHLHLSESLGTGFETIEQIQDNILYLSELKNLQHFDWFCSYLSLGDHLARILSNKIAMNTLLLGHCVVNDETIKSIKKMKNLKGLAFCQTYGLQNQHLSEIAQELTHLEELRIVLQDNITFDVLKEVLRHSKQLKELTVHQIDFTKCPLDQTLYNNILDIVQERSNGITLTIKTDVRDMLPKQTIQMNRNWLIIQYI